MEEEKEEQEKVKQFICTDEWDCRCERVDGFIDGNCIQAKEINNFKN